MSRELTGWHVLAIFLMGFGIIISVNVVLAVQAVTTFPGLAVANSYVASQTFDAERRAQDKLGWDVALRSADQRLTLSIRDKSGLAVLPKVELAELGRATERTDDRLVQFVAQGADLVADAPIGPGHWVLRLRLQAADGTIFRRDFNIQQRMGASE